MTDIYLYFVYSFMFTDTLAIGYGSWPKITTAVDNNLISKIS